MSGSYRRSNNVEIAKMVVFYTLLAISFLLIFVVVATVFPFTRDIDSMVNRAQISADATKMADRIDVTLSNMDRMGVRQGHAALIFKTPENDVALDYEALADLRDRARSISELDSTSVEYQTALDDMRGTLREIVVDAYYYALIRNPFLWIDIVLWIIVIVLFFAGWWTKSSIGRW